MSLVRQDPRYPAPPDYVRSAVTDELLESYICWREECHRVQRTYEAWDAAEEPQERALAFVAYRAALDREEQAERVYRACSERASAVAAEAA